MKKHIISIKEVEKMASNGCNTFSKKDDSPRGCKTVLASEIRIGDKIIINNYFHEVTV